MDKFNNSESADVQNWDKAILNARFLQGDQKVSVHLTIIVPKKNMQKYGILNSFNQIPW